MNLAAYQRFIIAYHGCDESVAAAVLSGREGLKASEQSYDWLGHGIYFWEHGPDRAFDWARQRKDRGKIETPAVIGAIIQLGTCFDLLDTHYTMALQSTFKNLWEVMEEEDRSMPENTGGDDLLLRKRDYLVLNWALDQYETDGIKFQTVRGMFAEGAPVFPGSGIRLKSHIQIAVRDPACVCWGILGHHDAAMSSFSNGFDIIEISRRASVRFEAMTKEERRQTLVHAGILTPKGEVCEPYVGVIVPKKEPTQGALK